MPIEYEFSAIQISRFRGIKDLEVGLLPRTPVHIIGANNAGKSTVLEAIAFALRGGGFHQYDLRPYDFFIDSNGAVSSEFEVVLTLRAKNSGLLPAVQGVGQPEFVHALRAKGKTARSGRTSKHFNLLDRSGKAITFSTRTPLKAELKQQLSEHSAVGWSQTSARHDHIRDDLPEVMLLTPDNIRQSLYSWKSGPLNRLAAMLADRFLNEDWNFDYNSQQRRMPSSLQSAHKFLEAAITEFPFWKNTLRPMLSDTLSQYV